MKYGYGRVSSRGQRLYGMSLEDQTEKLLSSGVKEEHLYLDTYTGGRMDRPKLDELLNILRPGDEFVVCKMDRFARTTPEGVTLVRNLVTRGIKVNILNMGVADNTPLGKMMVTMMLAFAEYERDMIYERTSEAKAYRREHDPNWREGRKRKEIDHEQFRNLAQKQKDGLVTVADCCRELGISKATWYEKLKEVA